MTILTIAGNEFRRIFHGPLSWIVLALVQFFLAITFFSLADQYQQDLSSFASRGITFTVVAGTLQSAGLLLLLVTPFLTMRLISEERRSGTMSLLLSAPISIMEIIAGKYLGSLYYFLLLIVMISLMPLSLSAGTTIDPGLLVSGLIGLLLLACSFIAIGLFASTLTGQPALAAAIAFGIAFLFWIMHALAGTGNETLSSIINYLSMQRHFNQFLTGIFSSMDLLYFLLLSAVFVLLSILRLDAERVVDWP